jgi:hypothetical protein
MFFSQASSHGDAPSSRGIGRVARAVLALVVSGGCGSPTDVPCHDMTPPSELVTRAALFRVEVYETGVVCGETGTPIGSPVLTRTFTPGASLRLDVAPGRRAVVLLAWSDADATTLLGRACSDTDLGAGRRVCLDLTLRAPPDMAIDVPDLATVPPDLAQPITCVADPSICGVGSCCEGLCRNAEVDVQHCGGCRACSGEEVATPICEAGLCRSTCLAPHGNCSTPAAPAADDGCETNLETTPTRCGACDRACVATGVDQLRCMASRCTSTCTAGLGNCSQPLAPDADDGCETDLLTSTAHCGACGRACSATQVLALACAAGRCTSSCQPGRVNCARPDAPTADDGCECAGDACCAGGTCQTQHVNGLGQNFRDCVTLGTHTLAQAQAARSASVLVPPTAGDDFGNTCGDGTPVLCRRTGSSCACWGYDAATSPNSGRVRFVNSNTCQCPSAGDATWN